MNSIENLPGAIELPPKHFYRVHRNIIDNVEVQIRRKLLIGSKRVGYSVVLEERYGVDKLEAAVKRAYTDFLDKTTDAFDNYFGDYK